MSTSAPLWPCARSTMLNDSPHLHALCQSILKHRSPNTTQIDPNHSNVCLRLGQNMKTRKLRDTYWSARRFLYQ